MIKIAICDDEITYRDKIRKCMNDILCDRNIADYEIDSFESGLELCDHLDKVDDYQIIFLDINMHGMNGIETAEKIRKVNDQVLLVFITAFADYAVEGYKVNAIRFVLKDMLEKMLPECMDTVLKQLTTRKLKIRFDFIEGTRNVSVEKIRYVENQKHSQIFCIESKSIMKMHIYSRLDVIEQQLADYGFLRIHKSYLVNAHRIQSIENYRVTLISGEVFPVPREKYRQVKEKYLQILGEI